MICFSNGGKSFSVDDAAAVLLSPRVEFEDGEQHIATIEKEDIGCVSYNCGELFVEDRAEYISDGCFLVTRKITNTAEGAVVFRDHVRVLDMFEAAKQLIDADANAKITSCTVTENASVAVALFICGNEDNSQVCSCELVKTENGRYEHRLIYPGTDAYITLKCGESFESRSYVCVCPPDEQNGAYKNIKDKALSILV